MLKHSTPYLLHQFALHIFCFQKYNFTRWMTQSCWLIALVLIVPIHNSKFNMNTLSTSSDVCMKQNNHVYFCSVTPPLLQTVSLTPKLKKKNYK